MISPMMLLAASVVAVAAPAFSWPTLVMAPTPSATLEAEVTVLSTAPPLSSPLDSESMKIFTARVTSRARSKVDMTPAVTAMPFRLLLSPHLSSFSAAPDLPPDLFLVSTVELAESNSPNELVPPWVASMAPTASVSFGSGSC